MHRFARCAARSRQLLSARGLAVLRRIRGRVHAVYRSSQLGRAALPRSAVRIRDYDAAIFEQGRTVSRLAMLHCLLFRNLNVTLHTRRVGVRILLPDPASRAEKSGDTRIYLGISEAARTGIRERLLHAVYDIHLSLTRRAGSLILLRQNQRTFDLLQIRIEREKGSYCLTARAVIKQMSYYSADHIMVATGKSDG